MVRRLETLTAHPDPLVRRAAIEGLVPFIRHTVSDPFEAEAPELLQPGWILRLSQDPDIRVRRRLGGRRGAAADADGHERAQQQVWQRQAAAGHVEFWDGVGGHLISAPAGLPHGLRTGFSNRPDKILSGR